MWTRTKSGICDVQGYVERPPPKKTAMISTTMTDYMWRGILCLSVAMRFERDRARFGVATALSQVRRALSENGLWLEGDEQLLSGVLGGLVSSERFAEALCSIERLGLAGRTMH